jgi:hypothetical protein
MRPMHHVEHSGSPSRDSERGAARVEGRASLLTGMFQSSTIASGTAQIRSMFVWLWNGWKSFAYRADFD